VTCNAPFFATYFANIGERDTKRRLTAKAKLTRLEVGRASERLPAHLERRLRLGAHAWTTSGGDAFTGLTADCAVASSAFCVCDAVNSATAFES
jgi:hypothetical protein